MTLGEFRERTKHLSEDYKLKVSTDCKTCFRNDKHNIYDIFIHAGNKELSIIGETK